MAITDRIKHFASVFKHSDDRYCFGPTPPGVAAYSEECMERVQAGIESIQEIWSRYMSPEPTYEDLYFAAAQLRDALIGEYENPMLGPTSDILRDRLDRLCKPNENNIHSQWTVPEILRETCEYISDVTWRMLWREPETLHHLRFLKTAIVKDPNAIMDVFTLNHDIVLERFFDRNDFRVVDGFGSQVNGVRYYRKALFEAEPARPRFIKLHGSVDWFSFSPARHDGEAEIGKVIQTDYDHTKDPLGNPQVTSAHPVMLVGTFNKMLRYLGGIFTELHYLLYASLSRCTHLLVCGYGFRDKGVNNRIISWLAYPTAKNLIVVHPDPDRLIRSARPGLRREIVRMSDSGRAQFIEKKIEDLQWSDVTQHLS